MFMDIRLGDTMKGLSCSVVKRAMEHSGADNYTGVQEYQQSTT